MSLVTLRDIFYSPVCDVDSKAYIAFISNCRLYSRSNGRLGGISPVVGREFGGGFITSGDDGGDVDCFGGYVMGGEDETGAGGPVRSADSRCGRCGYGSGGVGTESGDCRGVVEGDSVVGFSGDTGVVVAVDHSVGVEVGVSGKGTSGDAEVAAGSVDLGAVVGVDDDVREEAPVEGKYRKKNQRKKQIKKERKEKLVQEGSWRKTVPEVVEEKSEARKTLEAKWVVENKLARLKAEQELEIVSMRDVSGVAKLRERKVRAAGERAMVQIEKSHATLAATGNVPGVVPKGGYCTTVVDEPGLSDGSSPSCTISPDSSASMQELRELQKVSLDQEKKIADLEKLLSRREKAGRMNREDSVAEFTVNGSEVGLPASLCEVLDSKCGQYEYEGLCDGKHVVRAVRDLHFGFDEGEDAIGMFDSY